MRSLGMESNPVLPTTWNQTFTTTDTYWGPGLVVPASSIRAGTIHEAHGGVHQGSSTNALNVTLRMGTAGSTADAAMSSFSVAAASGAYLNFHFSLVWITSTTVLFRYWYHHGTNGAAHTIVGATGNTLTTVTTNVANTIGLSISQTTAANGATGFGAYVQCTSLQ